MNSKTLQGLKDSIEKWRQIERGEMLDLLWENCGLCLSTLDENGEVDCTRCPVMKKTGYGNCLRTPYSKWNRLQYVRGSFDDGWVADTPELVRLARAERKFLESLLPKGKS